MDTVTAVAKNLTVWGRKATVQTVDIVSQVGGLVLENGSVWLGKARVIVADSAVITWQSVRSRFRS